MAIAARRARKVAFFAGMDAEAEAYWYEAIDDPGLPAHEREDLIADGLGNRLIYDTGRGIMRSPDVGACGWFWQASQI